MRLLPILLALALASPCLAAPVSVRIVGSVEFNQITNAPLGDLQPSDPVELVFAVDSELFVDNMSFPTRGYEIDPTGFALLSGATAVSAQSPFPAGLTAYFVLRDNDPAVDGFFLSTGLDLPAGIPLAQAGVFGQFLSQFSVTYEGGVLASLDILDAVGVYGFDQLTVFNFTVDDGPFQPLGILFEEMVIEPTGRIFADGFESGDLSRWSAASP